MEASYLPFRIPRIRGNKSFSCLLTFVILICSQNVANGQISWSGITGAELNAIQTSVPFLTIAPDGRSTGMGDAGAASSPDVNSQHWNSGKYAFAEGNGGVALTYTPWLTNLIPEFNHLYLAGYYKFNDKNTISSSLRYFSHGTISFSSIGGTAVGVYHPREFAIDAGYSRKFTDRFSGGIVLRYIHSDLTGGATTASGQETNPGKSVAGDLGLYYQDDIQLRGKDAQWAFGLNISNVGTPVSYSEDAEKTPIPTNLRLGGRLSYSINEHNTLTFHADLNKLLVPTPALYERDSTSDNLILIRGKETPESVLLGMFQSFYDAPGVLRADGTYSVATEEFHEISCTLGAEYWYRKQFAIRTGYFHERPSKGNRKYFTFGMGARYRFLTFDLSYLLPVQGKNSPLYNTFRFSLTAELPNSAGSTPLKTF